MVIVLIRRRDFFSLVYGISFWLVILKLKWVQITLRDHRIGVILRFKDDYEHKTYSLWLHVYRLIWTTWDSKDDNEHRTHSLELPLANMIIREDSGHCILGRFLWANNYLHVDVSIVDNPKFLMSQIISLQISYKIN